MKLVFRQSWASLACLVILGFGCGKEASPPPSNEPAAGVNPSVTQQAIPATVRPVVVSESGDMALVLASLTDAVRKYSVEKRRVPANLDEVISAGYVQGMPPAPAGKKFAINAKREVELVNQ